MSSRTVSLLVAGAVAAAVASFAAAPVSAQMNKADWLSSAATILVAVLGPGPRVVEVVGAGCEVVVLGAGPFPGRHWK